jgi:replicative DNA helicase
MPASAKRSSRQAAAEALLFAQGLPSNIEAEKALLGNIFLAGKAMVPQATALLVADDFTLEKHRRIFRAMADLGDQGEEVDYVTVADQLSFRGELESVDGPAYLSGLTEGLFKQPHIEAYCRAIKEASERRQLVYLAETMVGQAIDGGTKAGEIAASAMSQLVGLGQRSVKAETLSEFAQGFPGGVSKLLNPSQWDRGVGTGFPKLDQATTGLHAQDLILIAARPSMGKTALALTIGAHAVQQGLRIIMFSMEMSKVALYHRLLCMSARVDLHRFRGGFLGQEERQRIDAAHVKLIGWNFHVDDTAGATVEQVRAECQRLRVVHGTLDLIVIDYLQLMSTTGRFGNRNEEVTMISKALKQLARDSEAPVVALSQLSRQTEQRHGDGRPRLSDLRDSGSLEQDADSVLFVFREEVYKPDRQDLHGLAEIIIGKQRNGPIGKVDLCFLHKYARFENRHEDLGESDQAPGGPELR